MNNRELARLKIIIMNKSESGPNYQLRRGVAATLAFGAVATGAVLLHNQNNQNIKNHFNKIEQEAINSIETARNSILIVAEGATYRTTPFTANDKDGGPDTVAGKIPEGHALKINNGLEHVDDINDLWVGFYFENDATKQNTARAEELNWVNVTELQRQSDPANPYITEFRRADIGSKPTPTDISISISPERQIAVGSGKDGGPEIGNAAIMTNAQLLEQLSGESLLING